MPPIVKLGKATDKGRQRHGLTLIETGEWPYRVGCTTIRSVPLLVVRLGALCRLSRWGPRKRYIATNSLSFPRPRIAGRWHYLLLWRIKQRLRTVVHCRSTAPRPWGAEPAWSE